MSTPTIAPSLQDVLLDALSDAIGLRKEEYVFCRDCRNSPVDHCLDHERDYSLARSYEEAESLLRASDPAALESILAALSDEGAGR